jgi:hypothetical protein
MLTLVFAALAAGPPVISLPPQVEAQAGRIVKLAAATDGKLVRWQLATDDADLIPFPDGKTALFCSPKAGRFVVFAWTAAGDEPSEAAKCVITVTDLAPVPPPKPVETLAAEFKKLLAGDSNLEKLAHLIQLAALYREAVKYADSSEVKTAGDLANRIRAAAGSLIPNDSLVALRKRIAEEIAKELPVETDSPLDAATRRKAAALFLRIAAALEAAK